MGLTFIAFEGYDLIATVAEEIKDPEKNIPREPSFLLALQLSFIYLFSLYRLLRLMQKGRRPGNF